MVRFFRTARARDVWVLAIAAFALASHGSAFGGGRDSLIAAVDLEYLAGHPETAEWPGFVISPEMVLVKLPKEASGYLRLASAVLLLESARPGPLWITPGTLPDDLAVEAGIRIVLRTEWSTVFEADRDRAYRLLDRGYFVVEVDFTPVSDLAREPLAEKIAEDLLGARPLTEARKHLMQAAADSVDSLSIKDTIYRLTYDADRGEYRSRFAPRLDLERDALPYLGDLLRSHIEPHGGSVETIEFEVDLPSQYSGGDSTFVNIIGQTRGTKTEAYYVICAHYDAIGAREPAWDWKYDPAPGADDNATGAAAVLECARLLSGLTLDVGLVFALFSGEELGLLGSDFHASAVAATDTILGVINFDMLGYVDEALRIEVWTDWRSDWLCALLVEVQGALGLATPVVRMFRPGVYNSDHASFWSVGIPAVMLTDESYGGVPVYPHYHTTGDTLGNLRMDQVCDNVRLAVGLMSRFAPAEEDSLCDLHFTDRSVEWDWEGRVRLDWPAGGDSLRATVRAINTGASMEQEEPYIFEVWEGQRGTGRLVHESTPSLRLPCGGHTDLGVSWRIDPEIFGYVTYTFVLLPIADGVESDETDNWAEFEMLVMSQELVVDGLHVEPNPVTDLSAARLSFVIGHPDGDFDGIMQIWVFDLLGRRIGYGMLERTHQASEIDVGRNYIDLGGFLPSGSNLPPGLYVCVAELRLIGESRFATARSRFAVAR